MLVLSRDLNEAVNLLVYDQTGTALRLEVRVQEIRGDQVRLGFVAPPQIAIARGEIDFIDFCRVHQERLDAQQSR